MQISLRNSHIITWIRIRTGPSPVLQYTVECGTHSWVTKWTTDYSTAGIFQYFSVYRRPYNTNRELVFFFCVYVYIILKRLTFFLKYRRTLFQTRAFPSPPLPSPLAILYSKHLSMNMWENNVRSYTAWTYAWDWGILPTYVLFSKLLAICTIYVLLTALIWEKIYCC
jgi:hypothetical protein